MADSRARARDEARAGGPTRPTGEGPRFALRFEAGRGCLTLARPLRFSFGVVEALDLDLGRLQFPLDLSAGARRFRTRRTRVRAAQVRVDVEALLQAVFEEPYALAPLAAAAARGRESTGTAGGAPSAMAWALRDAFGAVSFEAHARFEGPDLRVALCAARAASEGPAAPLARVVVAARSLGFELEEDRGALRAPRALSHVLMHALAPHGWRTPDDRTSRVALTAIGAGPGRAGVSLRTLDSSEPEPAFDADVWERARRVAPIVNALIAGDREEAVRRWETIRERTGDTSVRLREEVAGLGIQDGGVEITGPVGRSLALRDALARGLVVEAVEHARALALSEPCDAVAVEALCLAADCAMSTHPELTASLVSQAAGRRPTDARLALRVVEALARLGDENGLAAAVEGGLGAREPGRDRGAFAREAAVLCDMAGTSALAARLFAEAADQLPLDAVVLAGLAQANLREGRLDAALDLFDRAATAHRLDGSLDEEAAALTRAATAAERHGQLAAAEERLTRATVLLPDDPEAWARLARVRRQLGAVDAAQRAEDRVLAAVQRLREEGRPVDAALAQARVGAARRDTAMLRAALTAAERAQAPEAARVIVELALGVVGDGPARAALLAVRRRLEVARGPNEP